MRRLIKLLSPLIISILFLSCNNLYKQESSITLNSKDAVTKAIRVAREAIAEGDTPNSEYPETEGMYTTEELEAITNAFDFYVDFTVKVSGQGFSKEDSKSLLLNYADYINGSQLSSSDIGDIKFQNVPVGLNATVRAVINSGIRLKSQEALLTLLNYYEEVNLDDYPDQEELLEYLTSLFEFNFAFAGSEEITVHEGNNPVTIKMTWIDPDEPLNPDDPDAISGTGEIEAEMPLQFTIEIDASATTTYYKNKNEITVSLLDDSGEAVSVSNADWTFELRYGNTVLPDTYYSYDETSGKLKLKNLPASGTYQLTVVAAPKANSSTNFEMSNASFNLIYKNTNYYDFDYEFDAANLYDEDIHDVTDAFKEFIDQITADATIRIYGTTTQSYGSVFQPIKNYIMDKSIMYSFVFNEMTTSATDSSARIASGNEWGSCDSLRSIVLPDDLTAIGYVTFMNCTNLETVVFGPMLESIDDDGAFSGCTKLSNVVIPEDAPLTKIGSGTFSGNSSLKSLAVPATLYIIGSGALGSIEELTLADSSGIWYYTSRQEEWYSWTNSQTQDPSDSSYDHTYGFGTINTLKDSNNKAIDGFPENGSIAEKLLFAAQNTNYYFYCAK